MPRADSPCGNSICFAGFIFEEGAVVEAKKVAVQFVSSISPSGAMDSASDFGSEGCGFESRLGLHFCEFSVVSFLVQLANAGRNLHETLCPSGQGGGFEHHWAMPARVQIPSASLFFSSTHPL